MAIVENTQFGRVGAFKFWCQKVLPAVYDDSLSYYELLCKVMKWLTDLTDVTNKQSDAITELQETLAQFMEGEFDPYIEEKVDEWFEENEPDLMAEIAAIKENSDKVPDIETTLNYISNHMNNDYSDDYHYFYVNDAIGNDDNDGLSDAHPFKTLERALEEIDKGYDFMNVSIRSNGVYYIERRIFSNCSLHITTGNGASDITVYWGSGSNTQVVFYNSYIHLAATAKNVIKHIFPYGFHCDSSSMYALNIGIEANTNFHFGYAKVSFLNCDIVTDKYLRFDQTNAQFQDVTNLTSNSPNLYFMYGQSSHVTVYGTLNLVSNLSNPETVNLMRFDDSIVDYVATTNYVNAYSKIYQTALFIVRCFVTISKTITDSLENYATNVFDGNYSIVQHTYNNTYFEGV